VLLKSMSLTIRFGLLELLMTLNVEGVSRVILSIGINGELIPRVLPEGSKNISLIKVRKVPQAVETISTMFTFSFSTIVNRSQKNEGYVRT